jgi:hypothetical protein
MINLIFLLFELIQSQNVFVCQCKRDVVGNKLKGFEVVRKVSVIVLIEECLILLDCSLSDACKKLSLVNDIFQTSIDKKFVWSGLECKLVDLLPEKIIVGVNIHLLRR